MKRTTEELDHTYIHRMEQGRAEKERKIHWKETNIHGREEEKKEMNFIHRYQIRSNRIKREMEDG